MKKNLKLHPICLYCKSDETIPLTNYGKQIGNHFQCLNCKKQWCVKCKQRRLKCECDIAKKRNPYRKDQVLDEAKIEKLKYKKGYLLGLVKGLRKSDKPSWENHQHFIFKQDDYFWKGYYKGLDDSVEQLKLIPKNKLKSYIKELEEEIDSL